MDRPRQQQPHSLNQPVQFNALRHQQQSASLKRDDSSMGQGLGAASK
jgi:hypothetical protein